MKRGVLFLIFSLSILVSKAFAGNPEVAESEYPAKIDLQVKYLDRYPFFYNEGKNLVGIEKDILDAFVSWAKSKKDVDIIVRYKNYKDFPSFFEACNNETAPFIGAGTVTMDVERAATFDFCGPYLNNISVMVTAGWVPTLASLQNGSLNKFKAVTTSGSVHEKYLSEIQKNYAPELNIELIKEQQEIPSLILQDSLMLGYMDLLNYWSFVKENPESFVKIHRVANRSNESFGFVSNKGSMIARLMNEFFESGFGFTSTKKYHQILEKYLGYEIIEAVEVNRL